MKISCTIGKIKHKLLKITYTTAEVKHYDNMETYY
jgi:hypothetical protein